MYSAPRIKNCHFIDNYASTYGGAVFCDFSQPRIQNCIFENNESPRGAGMYFYRNCNSYVSDCIIKFSHTEAGMAAVGSDFFSPLTIYDCLFQENDGWGLSCGNYSHTTVNRCRFIKNNNGFSTQTNETTVDSSVFPENNGRGLRSYSSQQLNITNSQFINNGGNGIYVSGSPTVNSCLFSGNQESAIYISMGSAHIYSSTFVNNISETSGSAISVGLGSIYVDYSIIAFNKGAVPVTGYASRVCSDVFGNQFGDYVGDLAGQNGINGNFSHDPLFCNAANGDFHLMDDSPCLPNNNSCAVNIGAFGAGCLDDYICGDINNNRILNLLDITYLIAYLYRDGPPPIPPESADVNSSGSTNILDITYLIAYLYKGGPEPVCPQ